MVQCSIDISLKGNSNRSNLTELCFSNDHPKVRQNIFHKYAMQIYHNRAFLSMFEVIPEVLDGNIYNSLVKEMSLTGTRQEEKTEKINYIIISFQGNGFANNKNVMFSELSRRDNGYEKL